MGVRNDLPHVLKLPALRAEVSRTPPRERRSFSCFSSPTVIFSESGAHRACLSTGRYYPYPRCKGGTQGAHGADRVLLCQCFGCNCQGLPMLWGALGGFGSSAYCDLRQFSFRRRLFNPVQQVLAFRQLTGEAEQRLTLFRGIQLDRCLEEIPHIVQRFCACGVHR